MIPQGNDDLQHDFEIVELPSKSFRLNTGTNIMTGLVNNQEAVKQAIYIILNVERYEYLIHSWNFGVELADLYGKPLSFCFPEIKRRVTEALLQDDRITGVDDFTFETAKGKVHATFQVTTIFGVVESETEVEI